MRDYKDTLNLPSTGFPMRANLTNREPEINQKWDNQDLYGLMQEKNSGKKPFVLHDGPPFSNGNIHMGTALNKVPKDFIVKSKAMSGRRAPYVPGWDNHGMPIESAIIKKNKLDRKKMSIPEFRKACAEFAGTFVDIQRTSFKRLGILGDWENPYLTMDPAFEATEVKVFGEMYRKGFIYKGLKPVYWCPKDETALAEAEIEYKDIPCTSVYVKFRVSDHKGRLSEICGDAPVFFVIWTTTPWTLPGNMAIALHPRENYAVIKAGDEYIVAASRLAEKVMEKAGVADYAIAGEFPGGFFEYMTAAHPFLDRDSLICLADYVTMETGTGCVHIAPGFGADDYRTGMKYGIQFVVPVDDRGFQTEEAGQFAGMFYEKSNGAIVEDLKRKKALLASEDIVHQYPHCWRCRNPIIFRATPQWFCSVEMLRERATAACEEVDWIPAWGKDRMIAMIKERSDWCISRQRHWGLPIPVFHCADCGETICDDATINKISNLFAQNGSDIWFEKNETELLPENYACPKCGGNRFVKETDTLDGWFDSGSTHFAVLENNENLTWPADLYLEGADQYRGWFQSSLLTAIGAKDKGAPYKQILTHGWVVDGEGKAMHKSLGNSIYPEEIIGKYGADMLRLWVAAADYRADIRASEEIFKQLSESYRKIRNTLRILLANLGDGEDFMPQRHKVAYEQLAPPDKWLLYRLNKLVKLVRHSYEHYEFHIIYHEIHNFCSIDLSKIYVDITKDRLYCEKRNSLSRRGAQTVLFEAASALIRMLAPILSFTAEEAWGFLPRDAGDDVRSVFLNPLPEYNDAFPCKDTAESYEKLLFYRDIVLKALEEARGAKIIGKSLDADVTIRGKKGNDAMEVFIKHASKLPEIFIVSGVAVVYADDAEDPAGNAFYDETSGLCITVTPASGAKCARCWKTGHHRERDGEGAALCPRCRDAVC